VQIYIAVLFLQEFIKFSSIKVAEAAKIIENTQRDLNVALMNELSIIFSKLGINTLDVIEAAATKWNFMKMTPGLVGGHCIGVDPYYLTHKAEELGYIPEVILSGRRINDSMSKYVAQETVKLMIRANKKVKDSKILVLGLTFKENVADIRNSKVVDVIKELQDYGATIQIVDPYANAEETQHEYGLTLSDINQIDNVDAVILAVNHKEYCNENKMVDTFLAKIEGAKILVDIKNIFKDSEIVKNSCEFYWSL
jgi:nucleotide sugar dehydrogenase